MPDTLPLIAHAAGLASALVLLSFAVRLLWWRWQRAGDSATADADITQWHAQRGGFMMAYRYVVDGRPRTGGFFKVVDMTTRPDLSALHAGGAIKVTYCRYAPALSCPAGSETDARTYAAIISAVLLLIALWQGQQLALSMIAFSG